MGPVYVVYGPETFLKQQAVRRLVHQALGAEAEALGPTRYDGATAELADVLDEVRTLSLLGDLRVAIVEDADSFVTRNRAALERYCADPSDSGRLILVCKTFNARTRLCKAVAGMQGLIKCEAPRGAALNAWISERARTAYGKPMDRSAVARLREHVGETLGVLDAELSKLTTYVGARSSITAEDVDALVGNVREQNVFAITAAMADGDVRTALHHWERVLATDRAAPGRAVGGLAWGIRRLLDAHQAVATGTPVGNLARQFWTEPAVLERRLARVSSRMLEDQLCDLLAADVAAKTGRSEVSRAVERFIITHATAASPTGGR
ncbi:MAG: DNA polymerase III subunit delta [bacterium]|nr:DNA polymerase III subunit delta [bacterium]